MGRVAKRPDLQGQNRLKNSLVAVKVEHYPVLSLTFADGFKGDADFTDDIANFAMCQPLKDQAFFGTVKIDDDGYRLGWRLDDIGNELDYHGESMRNAAETAYVKTIAAQFRNRLKLVAAE